MLYSCWDTPPSEKQTRNAVVDLRKLLLGLRKLLLGLYKLLFLLLVELCNVGFSLLHELNE